MKRDGATRRASGLRAPARVCSRAGVCAGAVFAPRGVARRRRACAAWRREARARRGGSRGTRGSRRWLMWSSPWS
eukprot:555067-Pleurochrysis_carterae.AAC.2